MREDENMAAQKRDIKLSEYNISPELYGELKYFCRQYAEKKNEIEQLYGTSSVASDGMPHAQGSGNPTERAAMRLLHLKRDVEQIEEAAAIADPTLSRWILRSVTEGIAYEQIGAPISRTKFYDARRYFFYVLAQKQGKI